MSAEPLAARDPVFEFAGIGVTAFTTTRAAGDFALLEPDPAPANVARWSALHESLLPHAPGMVSGVQVHGAAVARQTRPWSGIVRLRGYDGHVLTAPGAAAITVADCVPVFLAHDSGVVAVVHAGWRGTAARIVEAAIGQIVAAGLDPAALSLHLGPAICGRCYEVGPDVYEKLTGWRTRRHRQIDLRALLAEQARAAGVTRLSASQWCTSCDNERFFSHRRGDAARQAAVIVASLESRL